MTTDNRRIPEELTLAEVSRFMGIHRTSAHRKFRRHLKWGTHSKRRVRVVPTTVVIQEISRERNEAPAIPQIDRHSERIAALLLVQERQAIWIAKAARKLGIQV